MPIKRRSFLAASSAFATFHIAKTSWAENSPNGKLRIAGIGVGGMGFSNLRSSESEDIVALCDVDHRHAAKAINRYKDAKTYIDFREMLTRDDIDAVIIATPDHTHAAISVAAMRAGKHVYCQKPLAHNVFENRLMATVAAETGVTTQMGIQGHSGEGVRLIKEWIDAGAIGAVREVDAWCSLSYYPWGHAYWSTKHGTRPTDTPAKPKGVNWDLWIGPAEMRPYHPAYHPAVWRAWRAFGSGMQGDRGAHTLDNVKFALDLDAPTSIEATSMGSTKEHYQLGAIVTYDFPERGEHPPLKLRWYEGMRPPRPEGVEAGRVLGHREGGVIFKGEKGLLVCGIYGDSPRLVPESSMKAFKRPAKTLERVKDGHEQEWIRAAKAGRPGNAHFGYSGPLTELCCLGNLAIQMDQKLEWDSAAMKVTNVPEANKLVKPPRRDGWELG